jgi:hypothetical protein
MISITLEEHLRPAIRLTGHLQAEFKIPVLLGGLATRQPKDH